MDILRQRLRQVRRAKDVTQQQLEALTGIHYTTISRIESGEAKQVYADTVRDLAKGLGVSIDYLMGLTDVEAPPAAPKRQRSRTPTPVS
jgi:transcriptional regulator with XRE-family HTH domain